MKLHFVLVLIFLSSSISFAAKQQRTEREPGASLGGRVTIHETPVAAAMIEVLDLTSYRIIASGKTDGNSAYQITDLAPGRYAVTVRADGLALQQDFGARGREVSLGHGEVVNNLDFTFVRGGAIRGRVSDSNGGPIVE